MLVLSRFLGESIRIDDDVLMTVAVLGPEFVELAVSSDDQSEPHLVTLGIGQKVIVATDVSLVMITNTNGKVRLGIDAPRGTRIERTDVRDEE